jgi:heat shock protein HslJ
MAAKNLPLFTQSLTDKGRKKINMQHHRFQALSILLMLLGLTGCVLPTPPATTVPAPETPEATEEVTPPTSASNALENTQWQLLSFGASGSESTPSAGAPITLIFDAGGQVSGQAGCNSFGGSYQVQGDTLVFGELVSTLMACADPTVMEQEQQYLQALQSAGRFEVTADRLTIWYDNESSQLNFEPLAASPGSTETPPAADQPDDEAVTVAERVEFEPGEISATRSGVLAAGGSKEYALAASAGQTMHVQTVGYGAPVSFTVYGTEGTSWEGEPQASDVFIFTTQFTVPTTADYLVILTVPADAPETQYDVTFTIDTSAAQPMTPQPGPVDRVSFDPTTNSAERSGMLPTGPGVQQYLLNVQAGLTLAVDATSDGAPLSMTIESPSGNQWIPEMMQTDSGYTIGHQLTLPEGGYYLVTLTKGDHTPSTNYTLTFTLE